MHLYQNNKIFLSKHKTLVGMAMVFIFVFTLFFSLMHIASMGNSSSAMSCPFSISTETLCSVELSEHIVAWRSLSLVVPLLLFLLLLVPFLRTLYISCSLLFNQAYALWELHKPIQIRREAFVPVLSYLQIALSRGILNPKLF